MILSLQSLDPAIPEAFRLLELKFISFFPSPTWVSLHLQTRFLPQYVSLLYKHKCKFEFWIMLLKQNRQPPDSWVHTVSPQTEHHTSICQTNTCRSGYRDGNRRLGRFLQECSWRRVREHLNNQLCFTFPCSVQFPAGHNETPSVCILQLKHMSQESCWSRPLLHPGLVLPQERSWKDSWAGWEVAAAAWGDRAWPVELLRTPILRDAWPASSWGCLGGGGKGQSWSDIGLFRDFSCNTM